MQYDGLAVGVALLALLALLVAARILWRSDWLLGWLRGSAGLLLLALAGLIALVANDVRSYQPLPEGKPLVTLSFLVTTPEAWVTALGDGQHGFPYLSGAGRLVLKDVLMLAGALPVMADSARQLLTERQA